MIRATALRCVNRFILPSALFGGCIGALESVIKGGAARKAIFRDCVICVVCGDVEIEGSQHGIRNFCTFELWYVAFCEPFGERV